MKRKLITIYNLLFKCKNDKNWYLVYQYNDKLVVNLSKQADDWFLEIGVKTLNNHLEEQRNINENIKENV